MKTDSPDPVNAGGTLSYFVTVTNVSDVDAQNAIVTDTMPAHVIVISATPGQGNCTGTTCNLGTIGAGKAVAIAYVVIVDADAPALLTNMACVSTTTPEKDVTNNCADENTDVLHPSVTPTTLPASATPKVLPTTGALPGAGDASGRLVLGLGIGLLLAGAFATTVARRREDQSR